MVRFSCFLKIFYFLYFQYSQKKKDIELFFDAQSTVINVRASWLAGQVIVGDAIAVPGGIKSKYVWFLSRRQCSNVTRSHTHTHTLSLFDFTCTEFCTICFVESL